MILWREAAKLGTVVCGGLLAWWAGKRLDGSWLGIIFGPKTGEGGKK